jgi:hypothetical protein
MRRRSGFYGSVAVAVAGVFIARSGEPGTNLPTKPSPPAFAAIQVVGPESVASGQSAQFLASVRQADGTTKSATTMPNLRWRSSNTAVLGVSTSGLATASPMIEPLI